MKVSRSLNVGRQQRHGQRHSRLSVCLSDPSPSVVALWQCGVSRPSLLQVFFRSTCRDCIATFGIVTIAEHCSLWPPISPREQAILIVVSVSVTINPAVLHIRGRICSGNGIVCHPLSEVASTQVTSSSWYFIGGFLSGFTCRTYQKMMLCVSAFGACLRNPSPIIYGNLTEISS